MQPVILSISAVDTSGGAGISQDTRVAMLHGCLLLNCISGITIQTEKGLQAIMPTNPEFFEQMLNTMLLSYPVAAVKVGVLCHIAQIGILANVLHSLEDIPVIWDPVIKPTLGSYFIPNAKLHDYQKLLEVVDYLSPNLLELSYLSGFAVDSWPTRIKAAEFLCRLYQLNLLLKGGHSQDKFIREGLVTPEKTFPFTKRRYDWQYSHGTGCALSTAFACDLVQGIAPAAAFKLASLWVSRHYVKLNESHRLTK